MILVAWANSSGPVAIREHPKEEEATSTQSESEEKAWGSYTRETAENLLENEYNSPLKAEPATPSTEHRLWSITVPVNSLQHDIFLAPGKDETPWMDQVRFDKELTALENAQKRNAGQTRAAWSAIVNDPNASNLMIAKIKDEYMRQWAGID